MSVDGVLRRDGWIVIRLLEIRISQQLALFACISRCVAGGWFVLIEYSGRGRVLLICCDSSLEID